jgi:tetratricopeptide (TPR) repeat protein
LEEALRRDATDARVWHALGLVRARLGDLDAAAAAYRSGLAADPAALENRLGLATLAVKRGDAAAALEHYDALLAARPRLADAHLGRSWALIGLGRFDDAEATLNRASALGADRRALAAQRALLGRLRGSRGGPSPPGAKQLQKNR